MTNFRNDWISKELLLPVATIAGAVGCVTLTKTSARSLRNLRYCRQISSQRRSHIEHCAANQLQQETIKMFMQNLHKLCEIIHMDNINVNEIMSKFDFANKHDKKICL